MYQKRKYSRMRQDYLFRKTREKRDSAELDKRNKIYNALASGKSIPTELRKEAYDLAKSAELDDVISSETVQSHIDDEYKDAGIIGYDPKIYITTSRDPSPRLKSFAKALVNFFPGADKENRGKTVNSDLVEQCRRSGYTDLVIVHETRGVPDSMIISHLPFGPTAYFALSNVVTYRDLQDDLRRAGAPEDEVRRARSVGGANPHLIFHNFNTVLGQRLKTVLRYMFPPAKVTSRRVVTFANESDHIVLRQHLYTRGKEDEVALKELGLRFDLRPYRIQQGTYDQREAPDEWALRPFMNKAKHGL